METCSDIVILGKANAQSNHIWHTSTTLHLHTQPSKHFWLLYSKMKANVIQKGTKLLSLQLQACILSLKKKLQTFECKTSFQVLLVLNLITEVR